MKLSPSLSLSLFVFLNQETGWFFVINDNKPDARCYISEFFILDSDISIMETRSHESHARWKGKRRMNREFLAATGVIQWDCDIEFACRVIITGSCASPRNVKCKKTRREKKKKGGRKWRQRRNEISLFPWLTYLLPINLLFHVLHVLSFSYPDEISEILFDQVKSKLHRVML